jgi:hypothetical protein
LLTIPQKVDIFKRKIKNTPLSATFPKYLGTTDEEAIDFITKMFIAINKHDPKRISCRYTNSTDTQQAKQTLEAVRNTLMRASSRSDV